MDDKTINDNNAYDELLKSFSATKKTTPDNSGEVKNRGEIYFSAKPHGVSASGERPVIQRTPRASQPVSERKGADSVASSVEKKPAHKGKIAAKTSKNSASKTKPTKKKKKKNGKKRLESFLMAIVILAISVIGAFAIRTIAMGCINDILAIDVSSTEFRVVLDKDMPVDDVIDMLSEKNLIKNKLFCKLFAAFTGLKTKEDKDGNKKDIMYPAGTYHLSASQGLEDMLLEIRTSGVDTNVIKVTFPEGYNVEQIAEKLNENDVCSAQAFYEAMVSDEIFEKFDFLSDIKEKDLRYKVLEGYLYPDTYEFYIGESATSVVERFLKNFQNKWTDTYAAKAKELGYSVDEILRVASIIEKEAFDAEQMPVIASVLYNRLDSSSFPFINCDSTAQYIDNFKDKLEAEGTYADYMKVYDTYQKTGLPIGPICCPGADAIYAALYPDSTDYYFFLHDKEGNIHLASTAEEHEANLQYLG
mgnify:CR=1 FL=1